MLEDQGKQSVRLYMMAVLFVVGGLVAMVVTPIIADAAEASREVDSSVSREVDSSVSREVDDSVSRELEARTYSNMLARTYRSLSRLVTFNPLKRAYIDLNTLTQQQGRLHTVVCKEELADTDRESVRQFVDVLDSVSRRIELLLVAAQDKEIDTLEGVVFDDWYGVVNGIDYRGREVSAEGIRNITQALVALGHMKGSLMLDEPDRTRLRWCVSRGLLDRRVLGERIDSVPIGDDQELVAEREVIGEPVDLVELHDEMDLFIVDPRFHPRLREYVTRMRTHVQNRINAGETVRSRVITRFKLRPREDVSR